MLRDLSDRVEAARGAASDARGEAPDSDLGAAVRKRLGEVRAAQLGRDNVVVVRWRPSDDLWVVALAGAIDTHTAHDLADALAAPLGRTPCNLIVELSQLTFIDSSGLRELVNASETVRAKGKVLVLVAPARRVARVFELVHVDDRFLIAESFEAALDRVRPGTQVACGA
jgi:anti-sigma B factor antagonist